MVQSSAPGSPDRSIPVAEVARLVRGELVGDPGVRIADVAPIFQAGPRELGFLADRRYLRFLPETGAGALLVAQELAHEARDVTAATVIECPIAEVAAYAGDPSNAPEWYRRISSAEWQTEPPIALGSKVTFHARFLGRDLGATLHQHHVQRRRRAQGPRPAPREARRRSQA